MRARSPNDGLVEEDEQVALGDEARAAADDERHRQRRDQRVDPEDASSTSPFARPIRSPAPIPSKIATPALVVEREVRRDDAGEPVDRADREVDPAGDHDERPGRGDDQRRRLLVEDVEQVRLGRERRARQREDDEEDHERDQDPERCGAAAPARPTRRIARRRAAAPASASALIAPRPDWSANAAARIALSAIASPSSSATMRPAPHHEHAVARGR